MASVHRMISKCHRKIDHGLEERKHGCRCTEAAGMVVIRICLQKLKATTEIGKICHASF